MSPILQQILRNYGTAVGHMPSDVAAIYLCHRCAGDARTVRNMRDEIIPALRTSPVFSEQDIAQAIAVFEARFPVVEAAA